MKQSFRGRGACVWLMTLLGLGAQQGHAAPVVTTLAGQPNSSGQQNGQGSAARFMALGVISVDGKGNLYVQDQGGGSTRVVTPSGNVTTIALNNVGYGPVLTSDAAGNLYFVGSDHVIYKRTPNGTVTRVAGVAGGGNCVSGPGNQAQFAKVAAMVVGPDGSIYLTESDADDVRKILPDGTVIQLAGSCFEPGYNDGPGNTAQFSGLQGIALDKAGNVYVMDAGTTSNFLRKITPDGMVSTIYDFGIMGSYTALAIDAADYLYVPATPGVMKISTSGVSIPFINPTPGSYTTYCQNGGPTTATFGNPQGAVVDANYNVYITDALCSSVRKISQTIPTITAVSRSSGVGAGSSITITGTGFDAVMANNVVSFAGGVTATPTVGSATSLTVEIPEGATSGPLTVASNGVPATGSASLQIMSIGAPSTSLQLAGLQLSATLLNAGNTSISGSGFCYSTQPKPMQSGSCVTATVSNGRLSATLPSASLQAGQSYYLRPYVTVSGSTVIYGASASYAQPVTAGRLMGGPTPVVGANVAVYAASSTPGGKPTFLGNSVTDAMGNFALGSWVTTPASGQLVYAVAAGGNPGAGINTAAAFMTVIGTYGSILPAYLTVNELTTVASAYQLQGLLQSVSCDSVPAPVQNGNCVVVSGATGTSAVTNMAALVDVVSGQLSAALRTATAGSSNYTTAQFLNSIASVLAGCVDAGSTSSACTNLLRLAGGGDTLNAMLNVVNHPTWNVSALFQLLPANADFSPVLSAAPGNWSLSGQLFMGTPSVNTCYVGLSATGSLQMPAGTPGFVYGSNPLPTLGTGDAKTAVVNMVSTGTFSGYLLNGADLGLRQTWYVRPYAQNGSTVTYGQPVSFVTNSQWPASGVNCTSVLTTVASLPGTSQYGGITSYRGKLYATSWTDHTVIELAAPAADAPPGTLWTQRVIAGATGSSGKTNGAGAVARFYTPQGIAVDSSGALYVADSWNQMIRKLVQNPDGSWTVSTLAGSGQKSQFFGGGSNTAGTYADGPVLSTQFFNPAGVAVDSKGNVYIADSGDAVIRMIASGSAVTTTIAGRTQGNYKIPQNGNYPPYVGVIAAIGNANGFGSMAMFCSPGKMRVDSNDNLYVVDDCNNSIRKLYKDNAGRWNVEDATPVGVGFNQPQDVAVYEPSNYATLMIANSDACGRTAGVCGASVRNETGGVLLGSPASNSLDAMPPVTLSKLNALHVMSNVLFVNSYNTLLSIPINQLAQP